jgi:uncharacterized membrane protein (UPF0127 family)
VASVALRRLVVGGFLAPVRLLTVALLLAACGVIPQGTMTPAPEPPAQSASACCDLGRGTAIIETGDGEVRVAVEVADAPEERARGLMGRESLAPDAGMAFLYGEPTSNGLHMAGTLIPLSAAFIAEDGAILAIVDMAPCRTDPCPVYRADQPYAAALEVNVGAFEDWGVAVGDRVTLDEGDT